MGFEAAYEQRHALELLEDLDHTVLGRGAEGEQRHFDKDRNPVVGQGRIELIGYAQYRAELRERAGLLPAQPEKKEEPKKPQRTLGPNDLLAIARKAAKGG